MCNQKTISVWIIILLIIVVISSCNELSTSKQSFNQTELNVLSVQETYPQVNEVAKQWDEDAYLEKAILYIYPKTENLPFRATFMYLSYSSPYKAINISYIVQEVTEIETRKFNLESPELTGSRLDPNILLLDSQEVLNIMYEQWGNEFYKDCKVGRWPLILTLQQGYPNVSEDVVWFMRFACNTPEKGSTIFIDANTADVLEIRR